MDAGEPVISVDAKKKENVGPFRNGGAGWRPKGEPEKVNVHDYIDKELGKVTPYGVFGIAGNAGWVSRHRPRHRGLRRGHDPHLVGQAGPAAYPDARRLLITADGGGSNGYRTRLWKTELARARRADRPQDHRLPPAARHRPGTSKWNKIEHRLFSRISMNWRGRPLTSHEVIVQTIAATSTRTGLTVQAELDTSAYPKGINIPDREIRDLEKQQVLQRHQFHGEWNYSLAAGPP